MKIVFHIGYHKTGTTWLQKIYFPSHDSLCLVSRPFAPWNDPLLSYLIGTPAGKFDPKHCRGILESQIAEKEENRANKTLVVTAERLSGHSYSGGYDRFRIAERIHAAFPEAKIICVIRNQIDMIGSVYKLLLEEGYAGSIESLFELKHWKGIGFDMSFYEYDLLIQKYLALFGRENVCILSYENMRASIERFLNEICTFIGVRFVSLGPHLYAKNANLSLPNRAASAVSLLNRFRRTELNPFPIFSLDGGMYADAGLHGLLVKCMRKLPPKDDVLSKELTAKIKDYYKESNKRLSQLVDSDFTLFMGKMSQ